MKISIHSDILVELADSLEGPGDENSILALLSREDLECWAPAMCIATAHEEVSRTHGGNTARQFLETVQKHVSSVPLSNSTISECLQTQLDSLEATGHLSVNTLVGIDAIVSCTLRPTDVNGLNCVAPSKLVEHAAALPEDENIPFLDLKAQFPKVYNEIDDRFTEIMSKTGFILGHHVEEFEAAFARLQGAKHCIGVSSGTDALHLAFMVLGIGPGDEVIVPVNTFIATAEGISLTGATPVFVDCNEYYNIDIGKARELLERDGSSSRIRAIVPVHLYGQPVDLDGIASLAKDFGIAVVEDCAQAHVAEYLGKPIGNVGSFGAFSFYPGKNLGAYGEAGALVTNDDELFEMAKMLRAHGEKTRYMHSAVGHNYRMEALQGAVLATKVKFIREWTAARQRNAAIYKDHLADVSEIQLPDEASFAKSAYHLFVIQADNRDDLREYLGQNAIATGLHYPVPLHRQVAYENLEYNKGDFPTAESQAARILSLPMYPELTQHQIERVCIAIKTYFAQ